MEGKERKHSGMDKLIRGRKERRMIERMVDENRKRSYLYIRGMDGFMKEKKDA